MADKKKETAVVVSQEQLADGIFSLWLQTEAAQTAKPGQFISMYTNDGSKLVKSTKRMDVFARCTV